jgi:hypothetical protein
MKLKTITREFIDKNGNTWNWEETPEVVAAVKNLHETVRKPTTVDTPMWP